MPWSPRRNVRTGWIVGLALMMIMGAATLVPTPVAAATKCNIVTGADIPSQQVARLYKAVFRRPPDPKGWNYWKGQYVDSSLFDIADFFVVAPEFTNLYGSANNDQFVRLVYQNVMGRDPDTKGYNYWLGLLNRGEVGRADMVVYFSESAEFKRRENDLYFETCTVVAPDLASVVYSTNYASKNSTEQTASDRSELLLTRDASRSITSNAFVQKVGDGDSWLGRRPAAAACTAWHMVPATVSRSVIFGAGLNYDRLTDHTRNQSDVISEPQATRDSLVDFEARVRAAAVDYPVDTCDPDFAGLTRMSDGPFVMIPEVVADDVLNIDNMVVRKFRMSTEQVRVLLSSEDQSIFDLTPSIADDLALVDENNTNLRAAGLRANDRLVLELILWEDQTGNTFLVDGQYSVFLTQNDLSETLWVEQIYALRVPPTG